MKLVCDPMNRKSIYVSDKVDGATNLDLGSLTERFQTRFQSVRLQPPENEVLAAFLAKRWRVPITITRQIAEGSQGNVRAALADLEMWVWSR